MHTTAYTSLRESPTIQWCSASDARAASEVNTGTHDPPNPEKCTRSTPAESPEASAPSSVNPSQVRVAPGVIGRRPCARTPCESTSKTEKASCCSGSLAEPRGAAACQTAATREPCAARATGEPARDTTAVCTPPGEISRRRRAEVATATAESATASATTSSRPGNGTVHSPFPPHDSNGRKMSTAARSFPAGAAYAAPGLPSAPTVIPWKSVMDGWRGPPRSVSWKCTSMCCASPSSRRVMQPAVVYARKRRVALRVARGETAQGRGHGTAEHR